MPSAPYLRSPRARLRTLTDRCVFCPNPSTDLTFGQLGGFSNGVSRDAAKMTTTLHDNSIGHIKPHITTALRRVRWVSVTRFARDQSGCASMPVPLGSWAVQLRVVHLRVATAARRGAPRAHGGTSTSFRSRSAKCRQVSMVAPPLPTFSAGFTHAPIVYGEPSLCVLP